jgi:hypothetical protein
MLARDVRVGEFGIALLAATELEGKALFKFEFLTLFRTGDDNQLTDHNPPRKTSMTGD